MAHTQIQKSDTRLLLVRLCRVHFVYIAAYISAIIIFDSWNLLAPEAVTQRWTLAGAVLIIITALWYSTKLKIKNPDTYKMLLWVLIITGILFAALNVYMQRGMASKAVMLFMVPIISAGIARSRSLLLATCSLSVAAYSIAAVRYFYENYGQGFRVELYGEVGFYSALFFIVAGLLLISFRPGKH